MKKLMLALSACVAMATGAWADETAMWFVEDATTVVGALTAEGVTTDGVWSNLTDQVEIADSKVVIDADDDCAVAYRPNAALESANATIVLTNLVFGAARKALSALGDDAQAAMTITTNGEGSCVFAVVDGREWKLTETAADPASNYTVKIDFAYAEGENTVSYSIANGSEWLALKTGAVNPATAKVSTVELAGCGSFAAFAGVHSVDAVPITPGEESKSYASAEEATNAAKKAVLALRDDVAEALGSDAARDAYRKMFGFTVTGGDGAWFVEAMLYPESWTNVVKSARGAMQQLPLADIAALGIGDVLTDVPLTNCVPGFFYSLYDGASVTGIRADINPTNCNILCGSDATVVIPFVSKPSLASGFFSIGVLDAPGVKLLSDGVPPVPPVPHPGPYPYVN